MFLHKILQNETLLDNPEQQLRDLLAVMRVGQTYFSCLDLGNLFVCGNELPVNPVPLMSKSSGDEQATGKR